MRRRDGSYVQYAYNAENWKTAKTFVDVGTVNGCTAANSSSYAWYTQDVGYNYDLAGRPLSALYSNQSGTPGVTWSYDAAGRRVTESTYGTNSGTLIARTLTFAWDNDGDEISMAWPDAVQLAYAYDSANRFSSVGTSGASVSVGYDTLSRITSVTRGLVTTAVAYDSGDRMASLAHGFPASGSNQTWTYGYSPASQILTSTSANSAWNWTGGTTVTTNVTPDGLNRNAAIAAVGWPCGAVGAGYNCNGDLTYDGVRTFTYDEDDHLLGESGPVAMALTYDPTGRLWQSVINGTTTQFLYDGPALVAEYDGTNDVLRRYAHGPLADNPVIEFDGPNVTASSASYYIVDRQGSIVATANSSGVLTTNQAYDAYGMPSQWTGTRFRYTGQIVIPEAQLYYYKARMYDPVMGRFLQTDPSGSKDDLNLYAYVKGDPVDNGDPTGLSCSGSGSTTVCVIDKVATGPNGKTRDATAADHLKYARIEKAYTNAVKDMYKNGSLAAPITFKYSNGRAIKFSITGRELAQSLSQRIVMADPKNFNQIKGADGRLSSAITAILSFNNKSPQAATSLGSYTLNHSDSFAEITIGHEGIHYSPAERHATFPFLGANDDGLAHQGSYDAASRKLQAPVP